MTPTYDSSAHLEEQTTPARQHDSQAMSVEDTDIDKSKLDNIKTLLDTESDYGDFANDAEELEIIDSLLSEAEKWQRPDAISLLVTDIEDYEPPKGVRLPKILGFEQLPPWETPTGLLSNSSAPHSGLVQLENGSKVSDRDRERALSARIEPQPTEPDTRPPIERFRRPPKKALSVTDLISPSWCELQYFYTLSKHGRKKRTPAMKQGTKVHQALEDEVHRTVPVTISKKEDSWGLRFWNIIQGLRTLRDTGRTRELEIWGSVGGELVNGVIDEVGYDCPDPKLEEETANMDTKKASAEVSALPEYQTSITTYLLATGGRKDEGQSLASAMMQDTPQRTPPKEKRIYITDVKTRAHPTLPAGASIRPTVLQLHLYHHMLENLAQGNFSLTQLAERYQLDVNETFSDSFIAQIGGLNQELFDMVSSQEEGPSDPISASQIESSQNSMDVLIKHNNLLSLWEFMMFQFRETFLLPLDTNEPPTPTPQSTSELDPPAILPTRLSPLLTAEYLAPTYKHIAGTAKKSIGSKSFNFNAGFLRSYLEDNLAWWRGDRPAKGVELQEAWKCRSCDFRDDCEWIHERDAAALAEAKDRKKMRKFAGADGTSRGTSRGTWNV